MSRNRRGIVLLGLAALLGGLAGTDVAGREAALKRSLGPLVPVVVARAPLPAGTPIRASALAVRHVPRRYAPAGAYPSPRLLEGVEPAVAVPAGSDVVTALIDERLSSPVTVAPGERIAEIVATGSPESVVVGGHVDVLVTRERTGGQGRTTVALEGAEVISVRAAEPSQDGASRVVVSLRVTVRQAVYLTAAQSFARELRVLPRPG